jgi:adenine-specific DNA-methyltransferase
MISPAGAEPAEDELDLTAAGRGIILSWLGRRQARIAIPRPRILEPVPEHADPTDEDPGNLVIEGDNRQAMVSLLPQYAGRIDVFLIDPPYNTGKNDFRYNDARFHDPDADTTAGDFVSAEDGGRHAKWLNQMAPTLRIIRELMAPHGVIFVHISDIELPRLLLLMEEIFDERNRVGTIVWKNVTDNNPSQVVVEHEYIVVWARSRSSLATAWKSPSSETRDLMLARYAELRADGLEGDALAAAWTAWVNASRTELGEFSHYNRADAHGPYTGMRAVHNPGREGYRYEILHPITRRPVVQPLRGYRFPEDRMRTLLDEGRILFGEDETQLVKLKVYLADADVSLRSVINLDGRSAANELARLFPDTPDVFKNAKPVGLEEYLLSFVTRTDSIVLDCFAGSATTGHAVMRLNKRDDGRRRFILVEEGNAGDDYATALTAERLRRARTSEGLPGGFSFLRVGPRINIEAFEELQHRHLVASILQTDASGRGGGIKAIEGATWVIGHNGRREAICLHYDAHAHTGITADILRAMYAEADTLGLARPLRVYGESCEIFRSESFRFFKLPDEVTNNLTVSLRGER